MTANGKIVEHAKTIAGGILIIVVGCGLVWYYGGNPFDELALIRHAHVTSGAIVEANEDVEHGDRNQPYWSSWGSYEYSTPDGRRFHGGYSGPGRKNRDSGDRVEIEYLPDNPAVSRIKGDGCSSVREFLWRRIGLGVFLLGMFGGLGLHLIRSGVRDHRHRK
jgi:hypothetical protein